MRNVFDTSVNEKSKIECPDFLISILKLPTPILCIDEIILLKMKF